MSHALVFNVARSLGGLPWRWRLAEDRAADAIAQAHGLNQTVARILAGRRAEPDAVPRLLNPTLRDWLPDPSCFTDMDKAAARLVTAIKARENIIIFGDYDVDGATSAAVLLQFLNAVGGIAAPYIPDRLLEGYGPSAAAMRALRKAGADLVLCVDCGTQGFEALSAAHDDGLDVIVVDHHAAGWALPRALAVVNPNRLDEQPQAAGFGHLAAVGLAFLLVVAVNRLLRSAGYYGGLFAEPDLKRLVDLVALGTVADVAPLTGLNRAFVTQGLKQMANRLNPGLAALADVSGLDRAPRASDLGFQLGPRINAGGRVGAADLGVRLLTAPDLAAALPLARQLDAYNSERKAIEAEVQEAAFAALSHTPAAAACVVVAGEGWHPGVLGIVAARVKERTGKPAIIIGTSNGVGKGSGRSVAGVNLGGAVLAARDAGLLIAGGGHAMAAGLTVDADRIDDLAHFLDARLGDEVAAASESRALEIDAALAPLGATADLARALDAAGPYGAGWPSPRVALGPARLAKIDVVGADHLRLILQGLDGARLKAMAFRQAETPLGAALAGAVGQIVMVAGRLVVDDWSGGHMAELHLDDASLAA